MSIDTSPEALAALDLRLIARLVHHRDFDIEDARDAIAALKAERDAALVQIKKLRLGYSAVELQRIDAALAEVK